MIKTQEYNTLKKLEDEGYLYLTRSKAGDILAHKQSPERSHYRGIWFSLDSVYVLSIDDETDEDLFIFILWEDDKPYNIRQLTYKYELHKRLEYTGEWFRESAMKMSDHIIREIGPAMSNAFGTVREEEEVKDLEWLKKQVAAEEFNSDINELELDVIKTRDVYKAIDQLDEPVILSRDWIDDHKYYASVDPDCFDTWQYAVPENDLQNLLVPKQEKITIDQAHDKIREESSLSNKSFDYYWNCIANDVEMYEVEEVEMKDLNEVINKLEQLSEAYQKRRLDKYIYGFQIAVKIAINMLRELTEAEEQKQYVIDTDDVEISDGNHYLTHLSLSKDDMELPIVGYKDDAISFENKEQAQAIADYVGGRIEEVEE